jgi:AcrR family transcriptional regulator
MRPSKRDTLLETAERLFYSEGFHATGIDRIVGEAGIARMTLYNHFDSKEQLVEAVLRQRYDRYLGDLRTALDAAADGAAVTAMIERHCRWLETVSNRGCIVVRAIAEFEQHHPPIAETGRRLKGELLAALRAAAERDGLPEPAATGERILVALEGSDALVPVIGSAAATGHARAIGAAIVAGVTATAIAETAS